MKICLFNVTEKHVLYVSIIKRYCGVTYFTYPSHLGPDTMDMQESIINNHLDL